MLLERLPNFMREIAEFRELTAAEQPEFDRLTETVNGLHNEFSVFTLTPVGIDRWEKILHITPRMTETLEERRYRIITKIIAQLPYSYRRLEELLTSLCGENGYTLEMSAADYALVVKVAVERAANHNDVVELVKAIVPANMITTVIQLYNRWVDYSIKTWGSLATRTWQEMKERAIDE